MARLSPKALLPPVLTLFLAACVGQDEVGMPPLTPEPGDTLPTFVASVSPAQTLPARVALYKYLRGIAAGDPTVCTLLAPEYARSAFGPTGCQAGLPQARGRLSPQALTALRSVTVPTAEPGDNDGEYVVRFETLRWRTTPAQPGGLLAAEYTLTQTGGRWLISA